MTRVLRIVQEDRHYRVCSIEVNRTAETYGVSNQAPEVFRSPREALLAVELTAKSYSPISVEAAICAECLDAYARHGPITESDALYALATLKDYVPLDENVPDLLGEFMEKRAQRNVDR